MLGYKFLLCPNKEQKKKLLWTREVMLTLKDWTSKGSKARELGTSEMIENGKLAQSIADASWGAFNR